MKASPEGCNKVGALRPDQRAQGGAGSQGGALYNTEAHVRFVQRVAAWVSTRAEASAELRGAAGRELAGEATHRE